MSYSARQVTNGTELIMAVYEEEPEIIVQGSLASGVYYGCKSFKRLSVSLILLFICLFASIYYPALMLPGSVVCAGLLALFSLPLIYLSFANISVRMINRIRRLYQPVKFDPAAQTLRLRSISESSESADDMPVRRRNLNREKADSKKQSSDERI
ncbi:MULTISPECIES: hypothetical protein [unclassified Anaerobiospirillum]|uniref:hypothetical protein n=1 Tax=unclassified Anaerobiospirillum TaxID=2647410 RepID=UPI001FF279C2|nr:MULTISPECIES: hypothetical protein [unclassified Anaerobiospirillum]MCK0525708.1 hypothetical protein [Anaerobiospirillum sp. NML120449]MCK0534446.1 hypothetical protein [Anaerobiospirillum sp. NML120511]MCK0539756.1 hypothetical protein [Anaerobiospirillum sp. NML02-A-032]